MIICPCGFRTRTREEMLEHQTQCEDILARAAENEGEAPEPLDTWDTARNYELTQARILKRLAQT